MAFFSNERTLGNTKGKMLELFGYRNRKCREFWGTSSSSSYLNGPILSLLLGKGFSDIILNVLLDYNFLNHTNIDLGCISFKIHSP